MNKNHDEHALSFQQIKFESELDHNFGNEISAASYGENLFGCIQCGTCSGTCPMSSYMDFTPRKIIAMVRAGFREEVLTNKTVWLCASCYSCTVECPKGIRITDVMYSLKREAITNGMSPHRFSIPVLANTFFKQVRRHGRTNEVFLMTNYYLSTNPFKAFSQIARAFKLFRSGRLKIFEHGIRDHQSLNRILSAAEVKTEATI
jgi:quinone-modifying oxidoreductase subunit QmoC